MSEPVELHDIVGGTTNDGSENVYEIPQAPIDVERYENLRINNNGPAAGSNIVRDIDTNHKVEDSNDSVPRSNCVKHISAGRQQQMLCAVLFITVIICSVTIGVLIEKLDSRISTIEFERQSLILAMEANEQRLALEDPVSAFAIYGNFPNYNSSSGVAVFSRTSVNIGDHYNTVTGQYTCYYPGVYVFSLNIHKESGASRVFCYIRKNGIHVAIADVPGYYESSGTTILHLNRGDTVDVGSCVNPSYIDNYTSFIGFLLKAD